MASTTLENELPTALAERPKKQAKIVALARKEKQLPDAGVNDENKAPLPEPSPADAAIDYVPSENLTGFEDPAVKIQGLVEGLESKAWLKVCGSLNDTRRFALHHSSLLQPILDKVLLVIVKAIKNPRSALCKTSIMAASDIFKSFGEYLLKSHPDAFNQLLLQLLLKASQDKKFVCEEADRALLSMVESMAPLSLLHRLSGYVGHSNPRIRAKAAISISNCVSKLDLKGMEEIGLVGLIKTAANLLNDKLPEAREASRGIVLSVYEASTEGIVQEEKQDAWQGFCQLNLPAIEAQAMNSLSPLI